MNSIRIINNDLVPDVRDIVVDKPFDDEAYDYIDGVIKEAHEHKEKDCIPVPIILNETKFKIENHLKNVVIRYKM